MCDPHSCCSLSAGYMTRDSESDPIVVVIPMLFFFFFNGHHGNKSEQLDCVKCVLFFNWFVVSCEV